MAIRIPNPTLRTYAIVQAAAVVAMVAALWWITGVKYATLALALVAMGSLVAVLRAGGPDAPIVFAAATTDLFTAAFLFSVGVTFYSLRGLLDRASLLDQLLVGLFAAGGYYATYLALRGWAGATAKLLPHGWQTRLREEASASGEESRRVVRLRQR